MLRNDEITTRVDGFLKRKAEKFPELNLITR